MDPNGPQVREIWELKTQKHHLVITYVFPNNKVVIVRSLDMENNVIIGGEKSISLADLKRDANYVRTIKASHFIKLFPILQ